MGIMELKEEEKPTRTRRKKKMTQKGNLFKGNKKSKTIPPNRHGKTPTTRKGKRFVKPSKIIKEMETHRVTKFINHCIEIKAATHANKEGGQLAIVKPQPESSNTQREKSNTEKEKVETVGICGFLSKVQS